MNEENKRKIINNEKNCDKMTQKKHKNGKKEKEEFKYRRMTNVM